MPTLVADIGGTNTRCALATAAGLQGVLHFRNADFPSLAALLGRYVDALPAAGRPAVAVLAVAAPIQGDHVRMINLPWEFSASALREQLRLGRLEVINDFEAQAWAVTRYAVGDLLPVGGGTPRMPAPRVVLGPGTGLGVAALVPCGAGFRAVPGEGGHVTLAAQDDLEERVIRGARRLHGHCSAERFLSGPGLSLLDSLLHERAPRDAAAVGEAALAGERQAIESFELFFRFLGTMAGNLALTFGAFSGVYIAGGVVPRYATLIGNSGFRSRFEGKGRYVDYLRQIPTWVVTAPDTGLTGLLGYAAGLEATAT
jgi:glucokinase